MVTVTVQREIACSAMRKRCTEFYGGESFRQKIRDIHLPASRFININHLQKKNSTLYFPVTFAKYIYDARAQVITFARLRFVRFAMDSCQPFGRINIIVKFDFSLVFFFCPSLFLIREALKNGWVCPLYSSS